MHNQSLLLPILLAAPLAAQSTIVIPPNFANAPAASSTAYPLGSTTVCRAQYIYNKDETGLAAATLFKSMEIRALQSGVYAAKTITMQIEMSTTTASGSAPSATFATNRGANHMIVFTAKPINLPATTAGFTGTWSGVMLFDSQFSYDPNLGNLLCEFEVPTAAAGAWSLNVTFGATGTHFSVGTLCGTFVGTSTGGGLGASLTYSATMGAPNNPAVLIIGVSEFPTPIPLPGNPGCLIYETLDATVGATLSATGTASQVLPLPNLPFYRGLSIYGQWVELNASALLESTVARRAVLQGVHNVGRCYSSSSNTALTGTAQATVGLIMKLGT